MNRHALYALTWPLHDPDKDIRIGHYWRCGHRTSACLTVTDNGTDAPWWQLSVAHADLKGTVPVRLWTAAWWDHATKLSQYVLGPLGADAVTEVREPEMTITRRWRKRLSLAEINKLSEVRERPGRPS